MLTLVTRTARTAASVAGGALAGATRATAALRPTAKPLHPDGAVLEGRLRRHGSELSTGVDLLDRAGEGLALVRVSRAVGLSDPWPDIAGLAVRLTHEGRTGDLLFATTGWHGPTRALLLPRRHIATRPLTTLLPYRTPTGPVVLGARPDGPAAWDLSWARGIGPWHAFGRLELDGDPGDPARADGGPDDADVVFDPVLNQLPGLAQYPVVTRLRRPSYRAAQDSRD